VNIVWSPAVAVIWLPDTVYVVVLPSVLVTDSIWPVVAFMAYEVPSAVVKSY
jgi:hypothetical protein